MLYLYMLYLYITFYKNISANKQIKYNKCLNDTKYYM